MKEEEFWKALEENGFGYGIEIEIYYTINNKGEVQFDEDKIMDECKHKIKEIKELIKNGI